MTRPVVDVLRGTKALLLDFDGPVCRVFAGHPNVAVATVLRRYLEGFAIALPSQFAANRDPLKLLQWVGETQGISGHVRAVDNLLITGEMTAVDSAAPTEGAAAVIRGAHKAGWPVAIVSNNSAAAIDRYLKAHELVDCVTAVVGRPFGQPERMKPRPDIVELAVEKVGVAARSCALIGDSPSDMTAAIAAGVVPVGYVKAPDRLTGLENAGAAALVTDMRELLGALVAP